MTRFLAIILKNLLKGLNYPVFGKADFTRNIKPAAGAKADTLNCRITLTKRESENAIVDTLGLQIRGSIHAPGKMNYTSARITITDITDGINNAKPVHGNVEKCQVKPSPVFCYTTELGRLPDCVTTISDWMDVASIPTDWITLPRKGKRNLKFSLVILSSQTEEQFACATCNFTYRNNLQGYIDLKENIRHAQALALPLAFTVALADKKISNREVEVIESWAENNIAVSQASNKKRCRINKSWARFIALLPACNRIRSYKICNKIAKVAPLAIRCDILDLCLHVVGTNGIANVKQLILLKNIASRLDIHWDRFRTMMEIILPACMHEVEDIEIGLGITSEMSNSQTRLHLTREYRKWNSRVTNSNPKIQAQAEHMLKLIAEAKNQYVG